MFAEKVTGFVVLAIFFVCVFIWYYCFTRPKEKRAERVWQETQKREVEESALRSLYYEVRQEFDIELETIHESYAQDEIVRVVNLLACQTAVACVNQDKAGRNEKTDLCWHEINDHWYKVSWDEEAREKKAIWSRKRQLALQIAPELASQMPHFSEFEPLKSYREEHLREKKARQK